MVSVDISHTLPIAASSSLDAHIRLWDLENGKQIKSIDAGPGKGIAVGETAGLQSLFRTFRCRRCYSSERLDLREASRCLNCMHVTPLVSLGQCRKSTLTSATKHECSS